MIIAAELNKQKAIAKMKSLKAGKEFGWHTPKLKTKEPTNVAEHLEPQEGATEKVSGKKVTYSFPTLQCDANFCNCTNYSVNLLRKGLEES